MAKFMAQDYVTGVVATLAWSAPEMLWGAKCTEKADIYSYGIVLWEIVTGEVPERGRLRDIHVPDECSEDVRAVVLECLETRPSLRPSAQQIVERLQASPKTLRDALSPSGTSGSSTVVMSQVPSHNESGDVGGDTSTGGKKRLSEESIGTAENVGESSEALKLSSQKASLEGNTGSGGGDLKGGEIPDNAGNGAQPQG